MQGYLKIGENLGVHSTDISFHLEETFIRRRFDAYPLMERVVVLQSFSRDVKTEKRFKIARNAAETGA